MMDCDARPGAACRCATPPIVQDGKLMTEKTAFASRQELPVSAVFDGDGCRASSAEALSRLSQSRVVIEQVRPQIDGGRFAVKRAVGDVLTVEADIYCDGHDQIAAALLLRR